MDVPMGIMRGIIILMGMAIGTPIRNMMDVQIGTSIRNLMGVTLNSKNLVNIG